MLSKLKTLLDRVDKAGDAQPAFDDLQLAAAALLVEAAVADGQFDAAERAALTRRLRSRFSLDAAEAEALVDAARQRQADSNHLLRFTKAIKDGFDEAGRIQLMEMLWEVVLADGVVDTFEDHLLRRLGGLLYVTDQDRGSARKRVEARLAAERRD
ncbi:putative tellurite resistance protein B-like protein [Rhodothalassium salexigens DSM 2132]|uniref:Putative tellurite resistance protein B-like protein n=1 Tax=Rhodothalassium salexigens DSM 2132 TaxID=1188247 RepID=A0A4R2PFL7_RHOSA|nr:TerB family tellurite resistance protein [Rhodothalassium salexigens]MBB4212076.1 putative tellurite resistance protein B-like protein [Rhodothalassium salexigens DSM 2132]MBK1638293.1 hypothetical protein [Rhodothalassium salexigens DSM 2132]TCP32951.1 putative tellurite resistance protein B-like protein [Rhodothalassium salexigens DSM 2132]